MPHWLRATPPTRARPPLPPAKRPVRRAARTAPTRSSVPSTAISGHPDGGFRRFKVLTDGHGLEVADGAEDASTEVVDGRLDVQVGADRYRFPATVRGDGQGK